MIALVLITLHLVVLHGVDGREVSVNPQLVTSLHADKGANKLVADHVHCLVRMSDGKFISVIETCETVKRLLEDAK